MKTAWVLEEDCGYEGTYVIGVFTGRKKARRAVTRIARQLALARGLKVPVFGAPEREPSGSKRPRVTEYECHDTPRMIRYVARRVPLNKQFPSE